MAISVVAATPRVSSTTVFNKFFVDEAISPRSSAILLTSPTSPRSSLTLAMTSKGKSRTVVSVTSAVFAGRPVVT